MNVLYVFCSQNFSGAEIVLERLISANLKSVNPTVLCPSGEFASLLQSKKIKVYEEPALNSLERQKKIYNSWVLFKRVFLKYIKITWDTHQILKKEKIEIVHANNLGASFYLIPLLIFSKLFRKKIKWIWSNHDLYYPDGLKSIRLVRICYRFFDKTLAVSQAVKQAYPEFIEKTTVLYNGLDLQKFQYSPEARENMRKAFGLSKEVQVMAIVGLISEGKGVHLVIEAFQRLLLEFQNIFLLIVGRFSPVEPAYQARITKLASSIPQCLLTGPQKNMPEIYSGIDILINASTAVRSEPLGTTLYEAMACERIVVASSTGGTPEIIQDPIEGFLFEPDHVEDLFKKLDFVIRNMAQLNSVRKAAWEKVHTTFDIEKMVSKYNQILFQL